MGQVILDSHDDELPPATTWAHEDQEACACDLTDPVGLSEPT